jgi:hypothetical protein
MEVTFYICKPFKGTRLCKKTTATTTHTSTQYTERIKVRERVGKNSGWKVGVEPCFLTTIFMTIYENALKKY